ncbi:MAG: aldehyde dehydrogenase family protein [Methanolinea sp.]|nr:aldehyde dehydrogenase family protein [Methanolinea sp.]
MVDRGHASGFDVPEHGCIVGGTERFSGEVHAVRFPYTGETFARVHEATGADLGDAVFLASRGFSETRELSASERYRVLSDVSARVLRDSDALARVLVMEGGKTIASARTEVRRAAETLRTSAEEAKRIGGEVIPLDWTPGNEGRFAITRRMPLGVVLGRMLVDAWFPPDALNVVPCPGERAQRLVEDPRISVLSFTGSPEVGWALRGKAGQKRVLLELGGSAPVIVHDDADVGHAAARVVQGGFGDAGQVCISVQRVLVHEAVYAETCRAVCRLAGDLAVGDPRDERTDVGPMISADAAERALAMVRDAVVRGARIAAGGHAEGATMVPTVVAGIRPGMRLFDEEVFAPVIGLCSYSDFAEALSLANRTRYGLQMGIFTRDIGRIVEAFAKGEFGGIVVNDVPTFRADHMPYGGEKASGLGREGPRYAIEEMTTLRLLALSPCHGGGAG